MDAIAWTILGLTTAAGVSMGAASALFGLWRDAQRERDQWMYLHDIASRDLNKLLHGESIRILSLCRVCRQFFGTEATLEKP